MFSSNFFHFFFFTFFHPIFIKKRMFLVLWSKYLYMYVSIIYDFKSLTLSLGPINFYCINWIILMNIIILFFVWWIIQTYSFFIFLLIHHFKLFAKPKRHDFGLDLFFHFYFLLRFLFFSFHEVLYCVKYRKLGSILVHGCHSRQLVLLP